MKTKSKKLKSLLKSFLAAFIVFRMATGCKNDEPLPKPKPDPVAVNKKPKIPFFRAVKGLRRDAPAGTKVADFSVIDPDGTVVDVKLTEGADKFEVKGFDPAVQETGKYAKAEIVTKAGAALSATEKISLEVTDDKNETGKQKSAEIAFAKANEIPQILNPKMKVEGVTNILNFDHDNNNSTYNFDAEGSWLPFHVRTNFANDLVIEAGLKDDGEIQKAVVEIIDTKTGKVVSKKTLEKDKNTGKLTTGDIGYYEYPGNKSKYNPWQIGKCHIDNSCKEIPKKADLYKDSEGNTIKIHFPNMKAGTYKAEITAIDDEKAEKKVKLPETVTIAPIKLGDFFAKLVNKAELERGFLAETEWGGGGEEIGLTTQTFPGETRLKAISDPRMKDLRNGYGPPDNPYCTSALVVQTNSGKNIKLMSNLYGTGFPFKIDIPPEVNKKCVLVRHTAIIDRIVTDLYNRKEINFHDYANEYSKAKSPDMQNFRDMYLSFLLSLTEHDDAYYLEAYLMWLLHYNRQLGGTVKNLAPEVEKMVKEAIAVR